MKKLKLEVTTAEQTRIVAALTHYADTMRDYFDYAWCRQTARHLAACDPTNDGPEVNLLRVQEPTKL